MALVPAQQSHGLLIPDPGGAVNETLLEQLADAVGSRPIKTLANQLAQGVADGVCPRPFGV